MLPRLLTRYSAFTKHICCRPAYIFTYSVNPLARAPTTSTEHMLVLATHFPAQIPKLISYQLLIVQHAKKFQYPAWLQYDMEYQQWAAANKHKAWSQIHPQLYAYAFTSKPGALSARWTAATTDLTVSTLTLPCC